MSVEIKLDRISHKTLNKRFKLMDKHYPAETFRAIVAILFDMKLIAQRKIKADGHIVTSRLRNSIFVKTPKQEFANKATNKRGYSFQGGTGNRDLRVSLNKQQGAVGTNVVYGDKIEKLDSYLKHAAKTVNIKKRLQEIPKRANKKIK